MFLKKNNMLTNSPNPIPNPIDTVNPIPNPIDPLNPNPIPRVDHPPIILLFCTHLDLPHKQALKIAHICWSNKLLVPDSPFPFQISLV